MRRNTIALLLAGACLMAVPGCGGDGPSDPPGPVPGTLTVQLTTPNADDRAILVRVTGPGQTSGVVAAGAGHTLFSRAAGTGFNAMVFGNLGTGPLVRFSVPDVAQASSYQATVVEVADPSNAVRASLAGYTAQVVR